METIKYLGKRLAVNIELEFASKFAAIPGGFKVPGAGLASHFPARRADTSHADSTRGQRFQFYMRSLKPSIWKKDIGFAGLDIDVKKGLEKLFIGGAPKGILRLPSSISNLTENYNATWQQQNILGSSQKTHKYQYTDRTINVTLELYSHSIMELRYNIWRLNWFADHCYGKLSNFKNKEENILDTMRGALDLPEVGSAPAAAKFSQEVEYKEHPFIKLSLGTVFIETPCYINSSAITYHMDSP